MTDRARKCVQDNGDEFTVSTPVPSHTVRFAIPGGDFVELKAGPGGAFAPAWATAKRISGMWRFVQVYKP